MNWKDHIIVDPETSSGKPVIKGTRLSVELLLDRLADGWSADDLMVSYPRLTLTDIQAVFALVAGGVVQRSGFLVAALLPMRQPG